MPMRIKPNSLPILFDFGMLALATIACVQDCYGVTFNVVGTILNAQNTPISEADIRVWNEGSFERPAFEFTTQSDINGYFSTSDVFSYGCTEFYIEVSAEGFETQRLTYNPPGDEFLNPLPDNLIIQLPITSD